MKLLVIWSYIVNKGRSWKEMDVQMHQLSVRKPRQFCWTCLFFWSGSNLESFWTATATHTSSSNGFTTVDRSECTFAQLTIEYDLIPRYFPLVQIKPGQILILTDSVLDSFHFGIISAEEHGEYEVFSENFFGITVTFYLLLNSSKCLHFEKCTNNKV